MWHTDNFEKVRREGPDLASAVDDFILPVLADRIEFANRQVAKPEPVSTEVSSSEQQPACHGSMVRQPHYLL
jgi:hypothetical protein